MNLKIQHKTKLAQLFTSVKLLLESNTQPSSHSAQEKHYAFKFDEETQTRWQEHLEEEFNHQPVARALDNI